jgi:hypothetical protein
MEEATRIFEKHWTEKTGKPLDPTTQHHMKYCIEAIHEALFLGSNNGSLSKVDVSGMLPPKRLKEMIEYVEEMEHRCDNEWGKNRSLETLIKENKMPDLYYYLVALRSQK